MKTTKCFVILTVWALAPCTLLAQDYDHRNRRVDSLEQVLATHPPEGVKLASIYNNLMMGYLEIDIEKSMLYARKCVAASIPINEWEHMGNGYYVLGMNHERISQFDSAMVYYHKTLETTEQMKNFPRKYGEVDIDLKYSIVYGAMGNVYNTQGKYYEAIEYYNRALKIFEKYNGKVNQCIAYNNIGYMYLSMENWHQAAINFSKSDSLALVLGDSLYIVGTKIHWSRLSLHSKEYAKALQNAEIAYDYYLLHSDEEGVRIVEALNLLSEIYLEGYGDVTRAEEYLRKTLEMLDILDIPREKAISLRLLSTIYLKRGQWRQAEQTALQALVTDESEPANTLVLYEILAKAYAKLGDSNKLWAYIDKHNALQSSWATKHYQSSIREMEVKYETEKKNVEIERQQNVIVRQNTSRLMMVGGIALCGVILILLWVLLRLRIRRNHALAQMNATKDKFFSIISHDLKNPAIAQRDSLRLLAQNGSRWDVDKLAAYYYQLLQSAEEQVELLYNLLGWAQVQTGHMTYTPETFILADLLTDIGLICRIAQNKGVAFETQIPPHTLVTGDPNMLAIVVRNLLTNAVKFTPTGGMVTFSASSHNTNKGVTTTIAISDTGVGMSSQQLQNLFRIDLHPSSRGTAGEQGSGLGLIVCKELVEKHGSTLHAESEEGKGSRFWFEVKGGEKK